MGNLFVSEGLTDNEFASVDSSLLKAACPVWHKSDMKKNHLPIAGIDTDAKWGFSKSKGWVFGYKLHLSCSTGSLAVPLSADVTAANIHDSKMYEKLVEPLAGFQNILCDPAYDGDKLYRYSKQRDMRLICPVKKYPHTPPGRIRLAEFYDSVIGQELYADRKVSIEPLFQIIKDTFGIRTVPVKGFDNVRSFVLICVLVYQLAVYYNCITKVDNPKMVKRMLCC